MFVGREFVIISSFSCPFLTGKFSGLSFKVVVLFNFTASHCVPLAGFKLTL